MSLQNEKHLLINQLQIKPLDFIEHLKYLHDEAILKFLTQIFFEGELNIFEGIIFYLGKEHNSNDSLYNRILRILLQYQDDIYFYVLDNLVPPILNYHLSNYNLRFHVNILHLSNYEPLLVKAIHFIEKNDLLINLVILLKDTPQIFQPLRYTIKKYDPDLARHFETEIQLESITEKETSINKNSINKNSINKEQSKKIKDLTEEIENLNQESQIQQNNNKKNESLVENTIDINNLLSKENNNTDSHLDTALKYLESNTNNSSTNKSLATLDKSEPKSNDDSHNNQLNNKSQLKEPLLKTKDNEMPQLDNIPKKIISNTQNLIYKATDNLSNFVEMDHLANQQQQLDNNMSSASPSSIYTKRQKSNADTMESSNMSLVISPTLTEKQENLNINLIQKVQEESILNNKKPPDVNTYDEFIQHIPKNKIDLLATFMRNVDMDSYLLLARNKTHLSKELNPSCQKIHRLINKPLVVSNKLGTNFKLENLSKLPKLLRTSKQKPILYFDVQDALLCHSSNNRDNKTPICYHHNVYQEYFYPYEKNKFGMNKQMYNLDVWLLLFQNIHYYDKLEDNKIGSFLDLFEIVIILPSTHYNQLIPGYQKNSINLITKNNFHFISAEDKLTPNILSFYLFSKFYKEGDLLLSPADFTYLQHGEGISINRTYKFLEEYLPFIVGDMENLKEILGQFYTQYNFVTEKIELDTIKKRKFSKKKTPTLRKKKTQSKIGKKNKKNVKRKYSKKQ